jgi:hypothetical protein
MLAQVFRRMGLEQESRQVLIAKQVALRRYGGLGLLERISNWLLWAAVGYGYRIWHIVVLSVFLIAGVLSTAYLRVMVSG